MFRPFYLFLLLSTLGTLIVVSGSHPAALPASARGLGHPQGSTTTPTMPPVSPSPTSTGSCGPAWTSVPAPPGPYRGIAPARPDDAWIGGTGQVLHWDGTTWATQPLPTHIPAVQVGKESAPAAGHLWGLALGRAVHWDGTAWTVLAYPSPPPQPGPSPTASFSAVAATAATDVWFAGQIRTGISEINPYAVLHWDGSTWTWTVGPNWLGPEAGPTAPHGASIHEASLTDISLVGVNDFWAVGYDFWYGSPNPTGPIIVHNQDPPVHPPGTGANDRLNSVSGSGPADVWMVGGGPGGPLAFHWDGGGLVSVPVPPVGPLQHVLTLGPQDAWAASDTALIHWDGSTWTPVPAPVAGMLAASGPQDIWTVSGSAIAHWPDLPLFSDVLGSNPFYPFVQALACRGLISGYTCGGPGEPCDPQNRPYFRWGANITRGQTAKIVANAAAFPDPVPSTQQTFADVPPSHPFWLWIERIAARGIISGYTCGGPGEPCDPALRPYFRAYNDVTRGQLAKIVSSAANFPDPIPSTQQTFADVPPSQPFWLWIERVAGRGIISGYGCGGGGEPCDPQARPYFRPGNPSTRGQTAKVVVNSFFPSQ